MTLEDSRKIYGLMDDLIQNRGGEQLALSFLCRFVYEAGLLEAVYDALPDEQQDGES